MALVDSERLGEAGAVPRRLAARLGTRFVTTRWSLVTKAAEPDGGQALAELCRTYWHPVQLFVQGHGRLSAEDAADVTQGLFESLLARNGIAKVDRARGRFRTWLRACARNYLYNRFAHEDGIAVGGGVVHVCVDTHPEQPSHELSPERMFDRRWALTVFDQALARLEKRYERANKGALFARLKLGFLGEAGEASDKELSALLGKSISAIKVERHRFKLRFNECLRAEVAETLACPDEVDDELRRLIDALS